MIQGESSKTQWDDVCFIGRVDAVDECNAVFSIEPDTIDWGTACVVTAKDIQHVSLLHPELSESTQHT